MQTGVLPFEHRSFEKRRGRTYRPIESIWEGEDAELLERLLQFYPRKSPRRILDATVNGGRFWRGSKRTVVGIDIESAHKPGIVADNTRMPFADAFFDVVVYDPPHIPNQGKDRTRRSTLTASGAALPSAAVAGAGGAGGAAASEKSQPQKKTPIAYRVLKDEGLLFAKIADYVHDHCYQWAHAELMQAGRDAGFVPCDCIIKIRKGPIIDPKWKVAHHSRRRHCYWLIFRKSEACE